MDHTSCGSPTTYSTKPATSPDGSIPRFGVACSVTGSESPENAGSRLRLPAFLQPFNTEIAVEDICYLNNKGALTLPNASLQSALLDAYIEYVHATMPVMDIHSFLGAISSSDGQRGQVSVLLYQAVMYSATAFVNMEELTNEGYRTRKLARQAFFEKARLLYDFNCERDRLVLVQALLHMSPWCETSDEHRDDWHWAGIAITTGLSIGLHRDPSFLPIPPTEKMLRKRTWWLLVMLDRLTALAVSRPMRINEEANVPMLQEQDFQIQHLSGDISVLSTKYRTLDNLDMQRELAFIAIHRAKLCSCIGKMLKYQHSIRSKIHVGTNSATTDFPTHGWVDAKYVQEVDAELAAWAHSLPASCQTQVPTILDIERGKSTVVVQRARLHMIYYATILMLHRPPFLLADHGGAPPLGHKVQDASGTKVVNAALRITQLATELHLLGLERYLSNISLATLIPAIMIHMIEVKRSSPGTRRYAIRNFCMSMRVIEGLCEAHSEALHAARSLQAIVRHTTLGNMVLP